MSGASADSPRVSLSARTPHESGWEARRRKRIESELAWLDHAERDQRRRRIKLSLMGIGVLPLLLGGLWIAVSTVLAASGSIFPVEVDQVGKWPSPSNEHAIVAQERNAGAMTSTRHLSVFESRAWWRRDRVLFHSSSGTDFHGVWAKWDGNDRVTVHVPCLESSEHVSIHGLKVVLGP